jgi:hypothetical protein
MLNQFQLQLLEEQIKSLEARIDKDAADHVSKALYAITFSGTLMVLIS